MASLGTAVMILPGVPVVITFVVRIVIGVFMPALLVTPARTKECMPEIHFHFNHMTNTENNFDPDVYLVQILFIMQHFIIL